MVNVLLMLHERVDLALLPIFKHIVGSMLLRFTNYAYGV